MQRTVLERLERGPDAWIDVLDTGEAEPLYRACREGCKGCRYTNDLWMAEMYVQQL